jgi:ketosteroid isomerase-like protein
VRRIISSLILAACVAGPALASDKTDIMATIHQYVDGLNKNDTKSGISACADEAVIIDDFPPHVWAGAGACAKWASDFDAMAKQTQLSETAVTLGKPRHLDVTGDRAYVVIPTGFTYTEAGKALQETGSIWTFSLHKTAAGWRITGWAWAGGKEGPAAAPASH